MAIALTIIALLTLALLAFRNERAIRNLNRSTKRMRTDAQTALQEASDDYHRGTATNAQPDQPTAARIVSAHTNVDPDALASAVENLTGGVIHAALSTVTGRPACWLAGRDGDYRSTTGFDRVTCPDCLQLLKAVDELNAAGLSTEQINDNALEAVRELSSSHGNQEPA
jgi:hypothetical protein